MTQGIVEERLEGIKRGNTEPSWGLSQRCRQIRPALGTGPGDGKQPGCQRNKLSHFLTSPGHRDDCACPVLPQTPGQNATFTFTLVPFFSFLISKSQSPSFHLSKNDHSEDLIQAAPFLRSCP